jgi:hypothetical protein
MNQHLSYETATRTNSDPDSNSANSTAPAAANANILKPHRIRKSRVDELQIGGGSLRRGRSGKFLEERIIAERIKHWIEPEQGLSERYISNHARIRYRE